MHAQARAFTKKFTHTYTHNTRAHTQTHAHMHTRAHTLIPDYLQRREDNVSRLKRVTLIGDHHQLPPVVQNMAIQKYSHLDQPLFTRFIRLGTPYVELNAQVRAFALGCRVEPRHLRPLGCVVPWAALFCAVLRSRAVLCCALSCCALVSLD